MRHPVVAFQVPHLNHLDKPFHWFEEGDGIWVETGLLHLLVILMPW